MAGKTLTGIGEDESGSHELAEDFSSPIQQPPQADRNAPLHLQAVPQHRLPRYPGRMRPQEWSLILARSYGRYLCRTHGAASAEVVPIRA